MDINSVRSDLGIAPSPEMGSTADEFPPLHPELGRVNPTQTEPTRQHPTQPILQESTPVQAAPITAPAPPLAHKSFVEAVSSQQTVSSFPSAIQHSFLAGAPPSKFGIKTESHGLPKIQFSTEETEKLAEHYKFAIIGKFSHGFPPYRNMHKLLSSLKLKGPFTVTMINNRHALINLRNEADFTRLWTQRLWHIDGFPMRTFKWTPSFHPQLESSLAPVWIRFPTLPAHLFQKDALYAIASLVGNPLKLDEPTLFQSRLTAARVCVEVDLANKLVDEIVIGIGSEEVMQKVLYENVPKYCILCKHVGHEAQACYTKGNATKPQRFVQQHRGNNMVTPRPNEKGNREAENVVFEIGEPSRAQTDRQQKVTAGIESNNRFNALNLVEGEGDGGQTNQAHISETVEEQQVERTKRNANFRYPSEPPNTCLLNAADNNETHNPQPRNETFVVNACENAANSHESPAPIPRCQSASNSLVDNIDHVYVVNACDNAAKSHESPAPLPRCQPASNILVNNIDHVDDAPIANLNAVGNMNVVEHCEGVAMEAPLQCVGPLSPNPFVTMRAENTKVDEDPELQWTPQQGTLVDFEHGERNQFQQCTLNQPAMEIHPVPANDSELDNVPDENHDDEFNQRDNDHANEEDTSLHSPQSSWEDATVRGRHTRSQSVESCQRSEMKLVLDSTMHEKSLLLVQEIQCQICHHQLHRTSKERQISMDFMTQVQSLRLLYTKQVICHCYFHHPINARQGIATPAHSLISAISYNPCPKSQLFAPFFAQNKLLGHGSLVI
ncbi:hypothetical protein Salat_0000300 [Sesamum alatum]|uniref:DUF4283 domain-containing protein n=1 Tax=Sesamum alatum TaxID=300844 RepID=A0AAE1YUF9_9LAMI|nr:hypothetical protein Salat_0000300 [Sesamum alatum]